MEKTHTVCPYSRATAGNVEVRLLSAAQAAAG
jgi:organic hydroperoxide reductase OsmC/OhrA